MKNDYQESHLPLADQGAIEALKRADKQGFVEEKPEPTKKRSDYERLLDGLYAAASDASRATETGKHIHIGTFLHYLIQSCPEAAHQIKEAIRHVDKELKRPVVGTIIFKNDEYDVTGLQFNIKKHNPEITDLIRCEDSGLFTPPTIVINNKNSSKVLPYPQEDIDYIRNIRIAGQSFEQMAANIKNAVHKLDGDSLSDAFIWERTKGGENYWDWVCRIMDEKGTLPPEVPYKLEYYAKIAEYLAKEEEQSV